MKRKRILSTSLVTVLSSVALIGCGTVPSDQNSSSVNNNTSKSTTSSTPVAGATASNPQYKGTIVISINNGGSAGQAGFNALAAAYKKVEPGVTLKWEPGPNSGNYQQWLGTQLAVSNPTPDIVSANYQPNYAHYVNLAAYQNTMNPYTGTPWNKAFNWSIATYTPKGTIINLSTQFDHEEWFYNKDIFNRLKIKPPKTWNQLVQDSKKIKAAGIIPVTVNYNIKVAQWLYEVYNFQYNFSRVNTVRARPGDWDYNPQQAKGFKDSPKDVDLFRQMTMNNQRYFKAIEDGKIKFDSPQTTAMVKNLSEMFPEYAQPNFFVTTYSDDLPLWLQGKAAMMVDGTGDLATIAQDMKTLKASDSNGKNIAIKAFNWGTFQNPSMTGPLIQAPAQSIEGSGGEYVGVVNKNQYQTNMDMNFLEFFLSKKGYQAWVDGEVKAGQFSPAGPLAVNGVKLPAAYQKLINGIKMQGNAENGYTADDNPGYVQSLEQQGYLDLENALLGKTTPQQYGKNLQNLWMDNFNTILQQNGQTKQDLIDPARAPSS